MRTRHRRRHGSIPLSTRRGSRVARARSAVHPRARLERGGRSWSSSLLRIVLPTAGGRIETEFVDQALEFRVALGVQFDELLEVAVQG